MTHHDPDANLTMPQGTEYDGRGKPSDGGQAFPAMEFSRVRMPVHDGYDKMIPVAKYDHRPGMTLRQWYAGQAIGSVIQQGPLDVYHRDRRSSADYYAAKSFAIADAMIAFEAQEGGEK